MREAEGIINNAGDGRDRGRNRQIIKYNLLCIVINLVLAVFKLTAVMQYGYRIIDDLKSGLNMYLTEKGFGNVRDVIGLSLDTVSETTDHLERDTVVYPKFLRDKCIGCGRCAISCSDGGHQAITFSEERKPILNARKCVGCHLCTLVCPQRAVISSQRRVTK